MVNYDRVIIHQFDPLMEVPGGIDTCIRGLIKFKPPDYRILVIGVDAGGNNEGTRPLGRIEQHQIDESVFDFIPVARLSAGNQFRKIPHSFRLVMGIMVHSFKFLAEPYVQIHRTDTLFFLSFLTKSKMIQYIHTQEGGLASDKSDSIWKYFKSIYRFIENRSILRANQIVVFNKKYAEDLSSKNSRVYFSPTWHDFPSLMPKSKLTSKTKRLIWIGRLEAPKDPILALHIVQELNIQDSNFFWTLDIIGEGSMYQEISETIQRLELQKIVTLFGYRNKLEIQDALRNSDYTLMTSHPGYEGFPRVLLESLSQGVPVIATFGSDTGKLIRNYANGIEITRSAIDAARTIISLEEFDPVHIAETVSEYSAKRIVNQLFLLPS